LSGADNLAEGREGGARDETFARAVLSAAKRLGEAPGGRSGLWRKAILIACWFVASYAALLVSPGIAAYLAASVSLAFAAAALAFNVFHDANHGSFCGDRRLNHLIAGLCCASLGVGRHFWLRKHNVLHHSYPNVFEWDDDIETRGHLRLSPEQEWRPKFRGQHLYFLPLYALNSIEWIFIKDFAQYFRSRINPYQESPPLTALEQVEFWLSKAAYGVAFVVAPLSLQSVVVVAAGFVVFHAVMGLLLAVFTQLAHINDAVAFPALGRAPRPDDWAAHQLRTTANFATQNHMVNWYAGGLNFQIEHHLFPHLPHTRYPAVSAVVREVAQQFGLPYIQYPTLGQAIASHVRLLRRLSLRDGAVKVSHTRLRQGQPT
jgi:linoleoyl-CoA desaturase